MECDVPAALARPVQLILRDRYGTAIDILDVMGPNFEGEGVTLLTGYEGFYHAPRHTGRRNTAYQEGAEPSPYPRIESASSNSYSAHKPRTRRMGRHREPAVAVPTIRHGRVSARLQRALHLA